MIVLYADGPYGLNARWWGDYKVTFGLSNNGIGLWGSVPPYEDDISVMFSLVTNVDRMVEVVTPQRKQQFRRAK